MAIIKGVMVFLLMVLGFISLVASATAAQKNVYKATLASAVVGILEWAAAYAILVMG